MRDLRDIGDFIARDNPTAAEAWVGELVEAVESIAGMPRSGRVVPELGREDIREVLRRTYRIVYRVTPSEIIIRYVNPSWKQRGAR